MNADIMCKLLLELDGNAAKSLTQIADDYSSQENYVGSLVSNVGIATESVCDGATWLILNHLKKGYTLSQKESKALLASVPLVESWPAQLHICQSIRLLKFNLPEAETMALWLQRLLQHKRPFLRAWSLDAMLALSEQHDSLKTQAKLALERATKDRAASVRARARILGKQAQTEVK